MDRADQDRGNIVLGNLPGALFRALFVILLIATPSLLLPGMSRDTTQIVTLVALFAAGFTIIEYGSSYPSLTEFRFAPPFNRLRFITLFVTVFHLALVIRGAALDNTLTRVLRMIGTLSAHVMDHPASPVRLMIDAMSPATGPVDADTLVAAAGISFVGALVLLVVFMLTLKLNRWPQQNGSFNVWINLPLFDPTSARDVVGRLNRDAAINVGLGLVLPVVIPLIARLSGDAMAAGGGLGAQQLLWILTLWAFLPVSLLMRGIAMRRVAQMIVQKRRERMRESQSNFLPA